MLVEIFHAAHKLYPILPLVIHNPVKALKHSYFQCRYFYRSFSHHNTLSAFLKEIKTRGFECILWQKPYMLGLVEWPYVHNEWDLNQRLEVILSHYRQLPTLPNFLNVADGEAKVILDLSEHSENLKVVIDRAVWFAREGEVVLNLFQDNQRVQSIAFSVAYENDKRVIYVGGIQGMQASEESLAKMKQLTKDLEGVRPPTFVIELLRMIADKIGATAIYAVADAHRHHRHPYFGDAHKETLKASYDKIWEENAGERLANGFYALPLSSPRKEMSEIASNKRAMYKRRYAILDALKSKLSQMHAFVFMSFSTMPIERIDFLELLQKIDF